MAVHVWGQLSVNDAVSSGRLKCRSLDVSCDGEKWCLALQVK